MTKLTILLMLFVSILSLRAEIKTGSCSDWYNWDSNVTYTLDTETGVLTISGKGAMANYSKKGSSSTTAPWGGYASVLTSAVIEDGVTSIGDYAFYKCSSLTSVTIPNSVTSIGDYAFNGCSSLTSVTIPNSVTSIGDYAFRDCSGLTSVTIPNSVTSIGGEAFSGCSGLSTPIIVNKMFVHLPESFAGHYSIPTDIEQIIRGAFFGCKGLTSVTIPNSVTSIGDYAFAGCSGLTSVTIPNSVTSIGDYAFIDCSGLTSVTIGSGIRTVGDWAFILCGNLQAVTCLSEDVPSASSYAFDSNVKDATLRVPAGSVAAYGTASPWNQFGTIEGIGTPILKKIELTDGEPYTNTRRTTYDAVTFSKTFSATNVGKWNALYVPISIDVTEHAADFDIAEIYAFCSTVDTNGDGTVDANDERFLFVRPLTNGQTYPNTPYLIRPREAKSCIIKSADNVLYEKRDGKVEFSTTRDKFVVTGLNEEFTVTANDNNYYVSGSGKLSIRTSGSTTVKPNRWIMHREDKEYSNIPEYVDDSNHLENDENADSGVKAYTIIAIGEDISEADAILAVKNANGVFVKGIYTLDGRLVDNSYNLPAGVYIKNGKKVIIK